LVLGVVFYNAEGKIVNANPAAEKILGLSLNQMKGIEPIDPEWKAVHEDGSDFQENTHPAKVALQTGRVQENVIMGVSKPSVGQQSWISINAHPLFRDNETKPYQVYATFEDISHKKNINN
jgi:PAS domain S-box-containing protein